MSQHVLVLGDAIPHLNALPPDCIDCVIADPPYGQTSLSWDRRVSGWATAVRRVLKPTGSMWVFGSLRLFMETQAEFTGWKMSHDVVWEKHNGAGFFNDRIRCVHELAAHFYRDDVLWRDVYKAPQFTMDATARTVRKKATPAHWVGARGESYYTSHDGGPKLQRSVIYCRSLHGSAKHPTQKPEEIVELLLKYACPENGVVLDPFGGSGTTAVAALKNNRKCILIELNPDYIEIARQRIASLTLS